MRRFRDCGKPEYWAQYLLLTERLICDDIEYGKVCIFLKDPDTNYTVRIIWADGRTEIMAKKQWEDIPEWKWENIARVL